MKVIDNILTKIGYWLIFRNKSLTATVVKMAEEVKNRKCDHCGLSPIHYIDNCECKK